MAKQTRRRILPQKPAGHGAIVVDRSIGHAPELFHAREWIETNGLGAHASSTLCDAHSRKYHGLLVASPDGLGKHVFLSKLEAELVIEGACHALSSSFYADVVHPDSAKNLESFEQSALPIWHWKGDGWSATRKLLLAEKANTVLLRWDYQGPPALLRLRPLLAFRDMHHLCRENGWLDGAVSGEKASGCMGVSFRPYAGLPSLSLTWTGSGAFKAAPDWWRQFEYPAERARGFDSREDLYQPGAIEVSLAAGEAFVVAASIEGPAGGLERLWNAQESARLKAWEAAHADESDVHLAALKHHGRHFLLTAKKAPSICAGYPWFAEWGRDAMIALPGLTVYSGRPELALSILAAFARERRDGLIPNYLGARGQHAYNSVDASLWFFMAAQEYLARTGDRAGVKKHLWSAMGDILAAFSAGKAPHVHCREDGLLWVGNPETQLTWMDACVHGRPVTPRHGMAVELNALWYNALQFFLETCEALGEKAPPRYLEGALRLKENFWATFSGGPWPWLADTVNEHGPDASLRPNQIFAVSLPHSLLAREQQILVVEAVTRNLVTPFGLRTLAPADPRYIGHYEGNGEERDRAYHQGTVWPWLVGAYAAAVLRTAPDARRAGERLLETFAPILGGPRNEYGVGGIAEIFDGSEPHRPAGCITQAWSVGEVIRARTLIEEAR